MFVTRRRVASDLRQPMYALRDDDSLAGLLEGWQQIALGQCLFEQAQCLAD